MSVLEVRNLCVKSGEKLLVSDLNFTLQSGKVTALLGKSGSGKSLSAMTLLGFTPPNLRSSLKLIGDAKMAVIMQNPRTAFNPIVSIKDHFLESVQGAKGDLSVAIDDVLRDVGLDGSVKKRYAFELSGGQLQRIMIAIALFSGAKFIIADEPTTDLDLLVQAKILTLLKHLVQSHELGMLLITHDLGVVENMADEVLVMSDGSIVEAGTSKQVLNTPAHPQTRELVAAHRLLCGGKL